MRFPNSDRVIYAVNPLTDVICQIRFPVRLGIVASLPAAFQEAIRDQYPNLAVTRAQGFVLNLGSEPIGGGAQSSADNIYRFDSADGLWSVILAKDNLTLTTRTYSKWEDFRIRWANLYTTFENHYGTGTITRIGLRYQDVVDRAKLQLGDVKWTSLIKPFALGTLTQSGVEDVDEYQSGTVLRLDDGLGSVLLRTLLAVNEQKEKVFVIDADFYADETSQRLAGCNRAEVLDWFDRLHVEAGRAFRWCITDELHRALSPTVI